MWGKTKGKGFGLKRKKLERGFPNSKRSQDKRLRSQMKRLSGGRVLENDVKEEEGVQLKGRNGDGKHTLIEGFIEIHWHP